MPWIADGKSDRLTAMAARYLAEVRAEVLRAGISPDEDAQLVGAKVSVLSLCHAFETSEVGAMCLAHAVANFLTVQPDMPGALAWFNQKIMDYYRRGKEGGL